MPVTHTEVVASAPRHDGWVAPKFEEVATEFDGNFLERAEIGENARRGAAHASILRLAG
jgi:hypothetical protein